jgi:hypothetical protein
MHILGLNKIFEYISMSISIYTTPATHTRSSSYLRYLPIKPEIYSLLKEMNWSGTPVIFLFVFRVP